MTGARWIGTKGHLNGLPLQRKIIMTANRTWEVGFDGAWVNCKTELDAKMLARELVRLMHAGASAEGAHGTVDLRLVEGRPDVRHEDLDAIPIGAEQ